MKPRPRGSHIAFASKHNLPPCPTCKAWRGDPCRTPGWKTRAPHKDRWRVAADEAHRTDADG
jgi:hypothetical protein